MHPNPHSRLSLSPTHPLELSSSTDARQPVDKLRHAFAATLSRAPLISPRIVAGILRAADGLLIVGLGLAMAHIHPGRAEAFSQDFYLPIILAIGIAMPGLATIMGLYGLRAVIRPVSVIARLGAAWSLVFAITTTALFLAKSGGDYSRLWMSAWFISGLLGLAAIRLVAAAMVRRWNVKGQLDRRAVLVGGGARAEELIGALRASRDTDVTIIGVFDDRNDQRSPASVADLPKLGNVSELVDFVRRARIDSLIVTLPLTAEDRLLQVLRKLWVLPVDIRLSAYAQKLHYRPRAYSYVGNVPLLDVFDKPLGEWGGFIKTLEDKIISALALLLLAPVMLAVAIAIKLESKGPVLFRQKRYGFNNELIEVFKFRSMYHEMADDHATRLVTRGDPRVTRVGRFIRKTSLDELPQFFNVLRGELSLVGPRPHPTQARAADQLYNDVIDGYFARHRVKPGITGWAQINGWRGETDTAEKLQRRVEHDLYYIENWSLALDIYILARTPISILKTENAY